MGTLTVDGIPGHWETPDDFGSLAPEQQKAIVQELVARHLGQPAPGAPGGPDGSLGNAAGQSLIHGLPGALASGLSGLTRYIESATGRNDPTALGNADAEDAFSQAQRLAVAKNYQRPDTVAPSVAAGFAQGENLGDSLLKAGKAALYGTAENAGPLVAGLVATPFAAEGLPEAGLVGGALRIGTLAGDGLQSLAGVRQAKQLAGLDPNNVTTGDMLNAGGQVALNSIGGPMPSGMLLRAAAKTGEGAARGAVAPVMGDLGAIAQGGSFDPSGNIVGNLRQLGNDAVEGAAQGGLVAGGSAGIGTTAGVLQAITDPSRAGQGAQALAAYQAARPAWDDAVAQAKATLLQNPGALPDGASFQDAAEAQAVAGGAVKPDMNPQAQAASARLAALQLFQARKAAEAQRGDTGKDDAATFKGVSDDLKSAASSMADGFLANDLIDRDTHANFAAAIAEAGKHNRNLAENGQDNDYLDTALDKVNAAPLDPALLNAFTGTLRTLDYATSNGLVNRTKGPLERSAGTLAPLVSGGGAMGAALFSGMPLGLEGIAGIAGAASSKLIQAQATSILRNLDGVTGWNKPQALQNADSFMRYATAKGLEPAISADRINQAAQDLGDLSNIIPGALAGGWQNGGGGGQSHTAPAATAQAAASPMVAAIAPRAAQPGQTPQPQGADALQQATRLLQAQQAQRDAQEAGMVARLQTLAPTTRTPWSGSMATAMGVQHGPMMEALSQLVADDPQLATTLQRQTLPRGMMTALTNHVGDLRDAGALPLANAAPAGATPGPQGAGIRNPQAYQAAIDQEAAAGNALRSQYPRAVAIIQAQSTVKGRQAALRTLLAGISDPIQRATMQADLGPLTQFGSKAAGNDTLFVSVPQAPIANDN